MFSILQLAVPTVLSSPRLLSGRLERTIARVPVREDDIPPILGKVPCMVLPIRSLYTLYTTLLIPMTALTTPPFLRLLVCTGLPM